MHSADAVVYPVVRSRRAGCWLAAIWLAGAFCVAAWCVAVPAANQLRLAMLLWTVFAGVVAARWWCRSGRGDLRWDGQDWSVESSGAAKSSRDIFQAQAAVVLDLQSVLLLRLHAPRRVVWVLLDRSSAPARWHGLRCAVTAAAGAVPHTILQGTAP